MAVVASINEYNETIRYPFSPSYRSVFVHPLEKLNRFARKLFLQKFRLDIRAN
jgi:hypothetical protein